MTPRCGTSEYSITCTYTYRDRKTPTLQRRESVHTTHIIASHFSLLLRHSRGEKMQQRRDGPRGLDRLLSAPHGRLAKPCFRQSCDAQPLWILRVRMNCSLLCLSLTSELYWLIPAPPTTGAFKTHALCLLSLLAEIKDAMCSHQFKTQGTNPVLSINSKEFLLLLLLRFLPRGMCAHQRAPVRGKVRNHPGVGLAVLPPSSSTLIWIEGTHIRAPGVIFQAARPRARMPTVVSHVGV